MDSLMKLTLFLVVLVSSVVGVLFFISFSSLSKNALKGKDLETFYDGRNVINKRLKHARNYCKTTKRRWMGKPQIFWDELHGIAYCGNAKAGTTKWLNLLFGSRNVNSSDSASIHKSASLYLIRSKTPITYLFLTCVRHPFTRLASTYLEKIPLNYNNISEKIMRAYPNQSSAEIKFQQKLIPGIDLRSKPTFGAFIKYIIEDLSSCTNEMSDCLYSKDVHWRPQVKRCDPCSINFNFIAKIESIEYDIKYLKELLWNRNEVYIDTDDLHRVYHHNKYVDKETESSLIFSLSHEDKLRIYEIYKSDFLAFDYSQYVY